jgi:cytochrome P450
MSQTELLAYPFQRRPGDLVNPPTGPADGSDLPAVVRVVLPTGHTPWLVSGHEEIRQMLRSPAFTSNVDRDAFPQIQARPVAPPNGRAGFFLMMDPPDHTKFRRMLTPEFMIKNMRRLEPLIRETVNSSLDQLRAAGSPADLVEHFALPVPSMVICHLLGVPYEDHTFFQSRSRLLLDRTQSAENRRAASVDLRNYLVDLIGRKVRDGGDDVIGRLAAEQLAPGHITMGDLIGLSLLLLIAGHETTANMIGLSVLALLRHPGQLAYLRENPDAIDDAIEELLRYLTIVRAGLVRMAVEDVEIGGVLIRAGEGAVAMLSAANRDPSVFDDADEFRVDRGSHQHMAFGFGIHQCIGQPLARAELRVALSELLSQFPNLALAGTLSDMDGRDGSIVYGLHRLDVTW